MVLLCRLFYCVDRMPQLARSRMASLCFYAIFILFSLHHHTREQRSDMRSLRRTPSTTLPLVVTRLPRDMMYNTRSIKTLYLLSRRVSYGQLSTVPPPHPNHFPSLTTTPCNPYVTIRCKTSNTISVPQGRRSGATRQQQADVDPYTAHSHALYACSTLNHCTAYL